MEGGRREGATPLRGVTVVGEDEDSPYRVEVRAQNPSLPGGSRAAPLAAFPMNAAAAGSSGGGGGGAQGDGRRRRGRPRKNPLEATFPQVVVSGAQQPMAVPRSVMPPVREFGERMSMAQPPQPSWQPQQPQPSRQPRQPQPPRQPQQQQRHERNSGDLASPPYGANFTPHVINVEAGEDVTMRILSFAQQGPRAICVLSANGLISNVTLRQPDYTGGTLTYEGRFELLTLSGSFMPSEIGGTRSRSGGMTVSLATPDGRVFGGGVAGLLIAATPVLVVVGSFLPSTQQEQRSKRQRPETTFPGAPPVPAVPISSMEMEPGRRWREQQSSTSAMPNPAYQGENSGASHHQHFQGPRRLGTDINNPPPEE